MNFLARQASKAALPIAVQDEMDRATALIEKATSDILLGVDWTTNLEIIDMTNRATCDEVTREIVRQVRKRLQHRSPRVVNLALSLAEALVKNCDTNLHREVATPKFMAQMARLARSYREKAGRENLEVADKALELIQSWGETFLPAASTLPLFAQTYHELKREGLPFRKQYDESHVPVLTPPASARAKPPMRLNTQPDRDLLDSVETSAGMLRDIMGNAGTLEDLTENDLFQEVLEQCFMKVRQVAAAIETKVMEGSEDLETFFKANDDLQATLQTYERLKDGSLTLPLPRDSRFLSNVTADSEPEAIEDFLAGGSDSKPKAAEVGAVGAGGGAALPKPPTQDVVPKLPPSRRDSFGKPSSRPSRTSRTNSAAADLLDLSSLDMSDSRPPPPQTAPASFQSTPQAPLFDFARTNPGHHPTSSSSLASQLAFGSGSGLSKSASAVDPFQAIPVLPPPRVHVSPTFKPPTPQGNLSSAQPLPSPVPTPTGADWLAFGAGAPGSQPSLPLSTSGQSAGRPMSGSLSMSGGQYPLPQQPTAFPPASPANPYGFPVQPQQSVYSSMGGYPGVSNPSVPSNASQFASYSGYPTQPQVTPMNPLQVSQQAPVQPQQPQAQQWATFGSTAPQQQQNGQATPAQNPFDTFPF